MDLYPCIDYSFIDIHLEMQYNCTHSAEDNESVFRRFSISPLNWLIHYVENNYTTWNWNVLHFKFVSKMQIACYSRGAVSVIHCIRSSVGPSITQSILFLPQNKRPSVKYKMKCFLTILPNLFSASFVPECKPERILITKRFKQIVLYL